ncbi:MAG: BPSS1780 family membrane protein [Methylophilus sp.]|uniref:BPSS1780 family membrane protein n=1 Tax=Methylophilus sp. TaxID=29541 RepID=UPI003FA00928
MTETGTQQGLRWVRESLALFKTQPHVWMLWSLAYIVIFRVLPSLDKILALLSVVIWPACMAFIVMLYRQMDLQGEIHPRVVWQQLQAHFKTLTLLGLSCLIYALLATYLLGSELAALVAHAPTKAGMTESQMTQFLEGTLSFIVKLLLLLLPLFIATWFSPMLIALNGYDLPKAIKSSIAGMLQYIVPMIISWVVMTLGMLIVMLGLGLVIGILGALIPMLAELLMPLLVFGALLVINALMFAFQYISYKDVFRAATVVHH